MVILCQGLSDVDVHENRPGILSNADSDLVALGWVLSFCVSNELPDESCSWATLGLPRLPVPPNIKLVGENTHALSLPSLAGV